MKKIAITGLAALVLGLGAACSDDPETTTSPGAETVTEAAPGQDVTQEPAQESSQEPSDDSTAAEETTATEEPSVPASDDEASTGEQASVEDFSPAPETETTVPAPWEGSNMAKYGYSDFPEKVGDSTKGPAYGYAGEDDDMMVMYTSDATEILVALVPEEDLEDGLQDLSDVKDVDGWKCGLVAGFGAGCFRETKEGHPVALTMESTEREKIEAFAPEFWQAWGVE